MMDRRRWKTYKEDSMTRAEEPNKGEEAGQGNEKCGSGQISTGPSEADTIKRCPGTSQPGSMSQMLSESALEATLEVMAEEGAIWSGAR
jgi:hypothetical protein